jgi:hypothetical protein
MPCTVVFTEAGMSGIARHSEDWPSWGLESSFSGLPAPLNISRIWSVADLTGELAKAFLKLKN